MGVERLQILRRDGDADGVPPSVGHALVRINDAQSADGRHGSLHGHKRVELLACVNVRS